MNLTSFPLSLNALETKSTVIISLKLPICIVPEGVIPAAHVYLFLFPFSFITLSAAWSAQWKDSFFYQSKHVLHKKGLMVLLTRDSLIVKKFASEFEFKIINALDFIQGDTKYSILKLKRS